jgi:hypothetical protein
LKVASAFAAAAAFALPWGVLHAAPAPPAVRAGPQVVALPGGQRVVIPAGPVAAGGVRYVSVKGTATAGSTSPPVTTTRASGVPKP